MGAILTIVFFVIFTGIAFTILWFFNAPWYLYVFLPLMLLSGMGSPPNSATKRKSKGGHRMILTRRFRSGGRARRFGR